MKVDAFHHKKIVWFDWLKRLLFSDEQLFRQIWQATAQKTILKSKKIGCGMDT